MFLINFFESLIGSLSFMSADITYGFIYIIPFKIFLNTKQQKPRY
nr:MAG TPA: hypothetical protein [Caudoviricetes sp.]